MPTPEQMANSHQQGLELETWLSNPTTPVRDIQKYIHLIAYKDFPSYPPDRPFALARIALDVRISDEAEKSSSKLSGQTDRLIQGVDVLSRVSEEQKHLAQKLEQQTNRLIALTRALAVLTVILLVIAAVQTCIMIKENASTHVEQVNTGQHEQKP